MFERRDSYPPGMTKAFLRKNLTGNSNKNGPRGVIFSSIFKPKRRLASAGTHQRSEGPSI
jgi:hypothetical protein